MSVPSAKFAFQINAHEAFKGSDLSSEKVLGSKKAEVTRKDGSTKQMTIFFAASKDKISEMQSSGTARSNRQTMEDFKRFCMATQKGLSTPQFAKGMRHVKEMATSENKTLGKNFADNFRVDYDTHMDVPYGPFAGKFVKANEAGQLVRVNDDLVETDYVAPKKTGKEMSDDEANRLRRKLAGTDKGMKPADLSQASATKPNANSDIKTDRKEKMDVPPHKRQSIAREKHINNRRELMADPSASTKAGNTQTVAKDKEAIHTNTQVSFGTVTTTNTNPNSG